MDTGVTYLISDRQSHNTRNNYNQILTTYAYSKHINASYIKRAFSSLLALTGMVVNSRDAYALFPLLMSFAGQLTSICAAVHMMNTMASAKALKLSSRFRISG